MSWLDEKSWLDKLKGLLPKKPRDPFEEVVLLYPLINYIDAWTDREEIATVAAALVLREMADEENMRAKGSAAGIARGHLSTPEAAKTLWKLKRFEQFQKLAEYLDDLTILALDKLNSAWLDPASLIEQPIVRSYYRDSVGGLCLVHSLQTDKQKEFAFAAAYTVILVSVKVFLVISESKGPSYPG